MKKIAAFLSVLFVAIPLFASEVWNGVVHITNPEQLEKAPIVLDGQWEFYPAQEFQTFNREQYDMAFIKVPGSWKIQAKKNFQANSACYRIKIVGLKPNNQYAIFSRKSPATASKFFANGELVASYGEYSASEKKAKPADIPVYAFLESDAIGSIELVVQVSSYYNHESGIIAPIIFAKKDIITNHFQNLIVFIQFLTGALIFACIINFAIFIGDRKLKIHCIFGFLLIGIMCHLLTANSNILSWMFPNFSYSIAMIIQFVSLWMSPQLFSLVMMEDKQYTQKYPLVDKIIFAFFSIFGIIIFAFPIKYTNYLTNILWLANVVFFVYAIYRMARSFATKQIKLGIYISFYILIASGYFFDILFPELSASTIVQFSQITILMLEVFDVFFMAYTHQMIFHNSQKSMKELEKVNESYMKFVSKEFLQLINQEHPEAVKKGDYRKINTTVLDIHLVMICADGRTLNCRNEFESYSDFMKTIYEIIENNNGFIATVVGSGCVAIFNGNPVDVFNCARQIIREVRKLNELHVKLGEASAMCSCGIHKGEVLAGVIGDENQLVEILIGPGVEIASRIENVSLKFGIPVLISKTTLEMLEDVPPCKLTMFQRSIITPEDGELYLFECHDEDAVAAPEDSVNQRPTPLSFKESERQAMR